MQETTFVDMFSGAGLFSAGAVQAGMRPLLAVDVSKEAIATYNRNVGPVAVVGSVTDFHDVPRADVLLAGPPCQGFSTLGRQDPLDARNALALTVPRWAEVCAALVVVVENVPPFPRSAHWREMAVEFQRLGYNVDTWELEAADYGTPQLRRRSFTVASRVGRVERPEPGLARISAGDALNRKVLPDDPMHRWPTPTGIAADRIALVPPCGDKRDIMKAAPHLCPPSWAKVGCQATDVWGRIDPARPANTLRCTFQNPSKGRYLHPTENRTLSLREGARLQGVPDCWQFEGRPYPVARQIGNGVPVPLAAAVLTAVQAAITSAGATSTKLAA
ncbi:DNA cytosine methyltransferase [Sphingomonas sp. LHG3443-2]|uniref:DNA cytosine methyltransferase n=1 Tax=Sphingomonas sp. LHG3443-2 TaxID=2804639 RepID=UPI003CF7E177